MCLLNLIVGPKTSPFHSNYLKVVRSTAYQSFIYIYNTHSLIGLSDLYPEFFRKRRTSLMAGICFMLFLVGLLTCTRSGIYWIDIIDEFTGGWGLLLSTLIEITAVGTLYGGGAYAWFTGKPERLVEDIEIMIGKRSKLWWFPWKVLWYIVTPVLLIVLLVWGLVVYETNPIYSELEYVGNDERTKMSLNDQNKQQ